MAEGQQAGQRSINQSMVNFNYQPAAKFENAALVDHSWDLAAYAAMTLPMTAEGQQTGQQAQQSGQAADKPADKPAQSFMAPAIPASTTTSLPDTPLPQTFTVASESGSVLAAQASSPLARDITPYLHQRPRSWIGRHPKLAVTIGVVAGAAVGVVISQLNQGPGKAAAGTEPTFTPVSRIRVTVPVVGHPVGGGH